MSIGERIREAGLRVTQPRRTVYAALHELGGHRSADELMKTLRERGEVLSRASVFNVLRTLSRHGLIMLTDAGPGRALYEAADTWHHHFVCRQCGTITDVPCAAGTKPCLDATLPGPGYVVDEAQVIFRGLCPACSESSRR